MKWKTSQVMVGNVGVGGDNPVRIQSMTTSNTRDVEATIEQIMRLSDNGCEIARITVQGMKEAEACEEIKGGLIKKGYTIPLVADIHFYPPAALRVADSVDKVRINPGNFVDKRAQFKKIEYNEATYQAELDKIEEKFSPLVLKCKQLKKAIRIGTNHGSLSDRIMNYYGDTPKGMVESAFEFTRVARKYDFHDIIFSMKASNPLVMIEAYRLLVDGMMKLGWDYPLHLGVTEAGEGEDGRVKSAIGIGSLLLDGIGDTIRVSLTEDPWFEIDPCKRLIGLGGRKREIRARAEARARARFLHSDGCVVVSVKNRDIEKEDFFESLGLQVQLGRLTKKQDSCDGVYLEERIAEENQIKLEKLEKAGVKVIKDELEAVFLTPKSMEEARKFFETCAKPVVLSFAYDCSLQDLTIRAAAENGALLCEGLGEGIMIRGDYPVSLKMSLSFAILQGCRKRNFKTEFISCPGCGRTLFNLQNVAAKIREKTAHLPGVKIAIMGCIVNGPGEMADADFGYVGSKPGKIDLYVGKEKVASDLDMVGAEDRLVDLIKAHGRWVEKV